VKHEPIRRPLRSTPRSCEVLQRGSAATANTRLAIQLGRRLQLRRTNRGGSKEGWLLHGQGNMRRHHVQHLPYVVTQRASTSSGEVCRKGDTYIMTKRDYIILAEALNKAHNWTPRASFELVVDCIADALQRDNPNFNYHEFTAAVYRRSVSVAVDAGV